jgi:SAM-dependent methyltransferase
MHPLNPVRTLWEVGATAPYADAVRYDALYRRRTRDIRFYVELAERCADRLGLSPSECPVLEIGAGTGRISAALARAGFPVVGVEPSAAMRAGAEMRREKLPKAAAARWSQVAATFGTLELGRSFPLVLSPFHTMQHLYTRPEIDEALSRVRRHLRADGWFAFDVRFVDVAELARDPMRVYRGRPCTVPGVGRCAYAETSSWDPAAQVQLVNAIHEPLDGSPGFAIPLSHRVFFPQELTAWVEHAGYTIVHRWGGFDEEPIGHGDEQVFVLSP